MHLQVFSVCIERVYCTQMPAYLTGSHVRVCDAVAVAIGLPEGTIVCLPHTTTKVDCLLGAAPRFIYLRFDSMYTKDLEILTMSTLAAVSKSVTHTRPSQNHKHCSCLKELKVC